MLGDEAFTCVCVDELLLWWCSKHNRNDIWSEGEMRNLSNLK